MTADAGRPGKFIAVANMKGGVGKTTTVVSLAETLSADDPATRVLVIDLDPQASASLCLAGDEILFNMIEGGRTLQDFLTIRLLEKSKKPPVGDFIRDYCTFTSHRGAPLNVSLLPCGPQLRNMERQIIYELTKHGYSMNAIEAHLTKTFDADIQPLRSSFDFVIFDCPPGISPITEVALRGSDVIIVPTIPDKISNYGLNAFCSTLGRGFGTRLAKQPPMPHVLPSRVQQNVTQHRHMLERFEEEARQPDADYRLMRTRIPSAAALAAALASEEIKTYQQRYTSGVIATLDMLVREVKEICHAG